MDDLNALFDSVDGLKEDLMEYGTIAVAAIGANVAWNYALTFAMSKFGANLPGWARQYGVPAATVLAGIFGGRYVARFNRKVGMGVTIGLVASGLSSLAKQFVPGLPASASLYGLGASEDEMLLGVGNSDLFNRYLNGAPSTVEQVAGLGSTPVAIEESVAGFGFAPATVEAVNGLEGFGAYGDAASTFTN